MDGTLKKSWDHSQESVPVYEKKNAITIYIVNNFYDDSEYLFVKWLQKITRDLTLSISVSRLNRDHYWKYQSVTVWVNFLDSLYERKKLESPFSKNSSPILKHLLKHTKIWRSKLLFKMNDSCKYFKKSRIWNRASFFFTTKLHHHFPSRKCGSPRNHLCGKKTTLILIFRNRW